MSERRCSGRSLPPGGRYLPFLPASRLRFCRVRIPPSPTTPRLRPHARPVVTLRWVDRIVVLVNGVPASGKTTLARGLARRLRLPLFSKDVIKEAHAEVFGAQPPDGRPQREWNRLI